MVVWCIPLHRVYNILVALSISSSPHVVVAPTSFDEISIRPRRLVIHVHDFDAQVALLRMQLERHFGEWAAIPGLRGVGAMVDVTHQKDRVGGRAARQESKARPAARREPSPSRARERDKQSVNRPRPIPTRAGLAAGLNPNAPANVPC